VPRYQAVVAVDESAVSEAWHNLVPRFFMAGGVAFLVSVVAAGLLARGITRPLRRITEASEDMARGRYDQTIPSYGGEEVSRLAKAFNEMAYQVSRSHRTLRDFLANVSHELKTPLTSVQGFSQAMVDGSLQRPEDFAEAGRIINDEAVRMRALVDDLLYLSQVEAGEIVMHFDRLDPNEVLQVTRERLARRADQAGVDLVVQPAYTPQIRADGRRLEQALLNIAENAVRHTPAGGRVTMRSATNNGNVRLAVHNTGSLIPPESLPLLFDRFYQAKQDFSRTQGTTGLGLAITKEIVEAHGGEIAVTSTTERGTEFVITLPVEPEGSANASTRTD
jgi:signal transduction histidine kinase